MKKQGLTQRSGVVRCQRCLKYGHYTYECENEVAYRYRPSRTVMYKEQIKLQLNKDKGPKTVIKDQDYKRIYVEDRPSSEDEQEGNEGKGAEEINKLEEEQALKRATQLVQLQNQKQKQEREESQSSSSSSSSEEELQPRKKRKI